ncbi:MAG: endonuclease III [Pseudomonadota bacterium]
MDQKTVREIFVRLRKENADPTTELHYTTPFELMIAVILSAHSTDKGVNKITETLFKAANTPEKILAMGETKLKKAIQSIGLYNSKAAHIMEACKILVEKFDSQLPNTREGLESLPGVGRKSANVLLNTIFGEHLIGVDTHIFRVSNRTGLAEGKTPLAVEQKLMEVIPNEFKLHAHHWLVLHGRYICTAKKPKCPACLISDLCEYKEKEEH